MYVVQSYIEYQYNLNEIYCQISSEEKNENDRFVRHSFIFIFIRIFYLRSLERLFSNIKGTLLGKVNIITTVTRIYVYMFKDVKYNDIAHTLAASFIIIFTI